MPLRGGRQEGQPHLPRASWDHPSPGSAGAMGKALPGLGRGCLQGGGQWRRRACRPIPRSRREAGTGPTGLPVEVSRWGQSPVAASYVPSPRTHPTEGDNGPSRLRKDSLPGPPALPTIPVFHINTPAASTEHGAISPLTPRAPPGVISQPLPQGTSGTTWGPVGLAGLGGAPGHRQAVAAHGGRCRLDGAASQQLTLCPVCPTEESENGRSPRTPPRPLAGWVSSVGRPTCPAAPGQTPATQSPANAVLSLLAPSPCLPPTSTPA